MTIQNIPVIADVPDYVLSTRLDGAPFTFRFRFSQSEEYWYFDLFDGLDVIVVSGVKLVLGVSLLSLVTKSNRPIGVLLLVDKTAKHVEATLASFGTDARLVYVPSTDVV